MGEMYDEYQKMLDQGIYDDEEDLMNQEGLSYDDLYKDGNRYDEEDDFDEDFDDDLGNRLEDELDNDLDDEFNKDY